MQNSGQHRAATTTSRQKEPDYQSTTFPFLPFHSQHVGKAGIDSTGQHDEEVWEGRTGGTAPQPESKEMVSRRG